MKMMTGYEFWWYSTVCSVIQLQKYDFFSKIANPSSRKQLGFYNKKSGFVKIEARSAKSESDFSLKLGQPGLTLLHRSTIWSHRSPIFYEAKASKFQHKSNYDDINRSTISCFPWSSKLSFLALNSCRKHLNSAKNYIKIALKVMYDLVSSQPQTCIITCPQGINFKNEIQQ
jgi:hypothetical protein